SGGRRYSAVPVVTEAVHRPAKGAPVGHSASEMPRKQGRAFPARYPAASGGNSRGAMRCASHGCLPSLLPLPMSARVHLSPDATVALVELEGTVRWRHLAAALLGLFGRDDSNPGLHVLWDARRVTRLDLPPQQVSALISLLDRVRGRYEGGRSAVLVR